MENTVDIKPKTYDLETIIRELNNLDEITLADTVDLMKNSDYKLRFVAEYVQTKIRYNNLHKMLIKNEAGTLGFTPTCDISLLEDQLYNMNSYIKNLEVRAEVEKIPLPRI